MDYKEKSTIDVDPLAVVADIGVSKDECRRQKPKKIIENKQIVSDLSAFLSSLSHGIDENDVPGTYNRLEAFKTIDRIELAKFSAFCNQLNIPSKLLNIWSPNDPVWSSAAISISIMIKSSPKYGEAFVNQGIIAFIQGKLFVVPMSKDRTFELLDILYALSDTSVEFRDLVFPSVDFSKVTAFCMQRFDMIRMVEFLIRFAISLCKYQSLPIEIFEYCAEVLDIVFEPYQDKYLNIIIMLIAYLSFSNLFVQYAIDNSLIETIAKYVTLSAPKSILSSIALTMLNLITCGFEPTSAVFESLSVFFQCQSYPNIIVPTCKMAEILIEKMFLNEQDVDMQLLVSLVLEQPFSLKKAAFDLILCCVSKWDNSVFIAVDFGVIDAIILMLSSNNDDIIHDSIVMLMRVVSVNQSLMHNNRISIEFEEKGGISILEEILPDASEATRAKIEEFLTSFFPKEE